MMQKLTVGENVDLESGNGIKSMLNRCMHALQIAMDEYGSGTNHGANGSYFSRHDRHDQRLRQADKATRRRKPILLLLTASQQVRATPFVANFARLGSGILMKTVSRLVPRHRVSQFARLLAFIRQLTRSAGLYLSSLQHHDLPELLPRMLDAHPSTLIARADVIMTPPRADGYAPRRISQVSLLVATLVLLCIAEFNIPGGLTPRREKEKILAKRVAEQLDLISPDDPNLVLPGGPLPIDKVHRQALVHRGSWMFALDSHLRLLLTWRAPAMKTCPMTWAPIGEHAIANETFEEAAKRGLSEEAGFIPRPRIYPIGAPFYYHYVYDNGTEEERTDNQWTQAYVVLPRGDALDFRTLDDRDAQIGTADAENTRYQGMSLPDVVKHAIQRPEYFCHATQVKWILQVIPLVIRVLESRDKRLFRGYLRDEWATLVESGSPVCCKESEHPKLVAEVNVSLCGVPCEVPTDDSSDGDPAS